MSENTKVAPVAGDELARLMEQVIIKGDLRALTPQERVRYYREICESTGLNWRTKPMEYIELNGRLTLYWRKEATDQLRKIHGVSLIIAAREKIGEVYVVTARAKDATGRTDESTGAVALGKAYGDNLANAYMKAETKAKRRVTLSIVGLGMLDESEVETIEGSKKVTVDLETGEFETSSVARVIEGRPETPESETHSEPEIKRIADHSLLDLQNFAIKCGKYFNKTLGSVPIEKLKEDVQWWEKNTSRNNKAPEYIRMANQFLKIIENQAH